MGPTKKTGVPQSLLMLVWWANNGTKSGAHIVNVGIIIY